MKLQGTLVESSRQIGHRHEIEFLDGSSEAFVVAKLIQADTPAGKGTFQEKDKAMEMGRENNGKHGPMAGRWCPETGLFPGSLLVNLLVGKAAVQ